MKFTEPGGGGRREDLSLRELLYVLWSRRMLVVGAVVVLLAAAMIFAFSREPTYTAEATIEIIPRQQEPSQDERDTLLDEALAVVADDELLMQAAAESGWQGGASDFMSRLEPEPFVGQERSGVIVGFTGDTPEAAAEAANAYATLFVEKAERLSERRIAGGTLAAEASVSSEAVAPNFRSSPRPLLYALAAIGAGVLVGGGAALLLEGRASSWRDARDAEMTLKAPVIGVIPDYSVLEKDAPEKDALEKEKP